MEPSPDLLVNPIVHTNTSGTTRSLLSRTFTLGGSSAQDGDSGPKGPPGPTTLHVPSGRDPAVADIIFVHRLNGGSQSTWTKGGSASNFWPREWLPRDTAFQDVRIHSFGYPKALSRKSILNVADFARSLLAAVKESPVKTLGNQPRIIFSHSMGGLVVKKALILAHQEHGLQPTSQRICSLFFLATLHNGAAIAQTIARLLTMAGASPFVDDLFPQSPLLQAIREDFPLHNAITPKSSSCRSMKSRPRA